MLLVNRQRAKASDMLEEDEKAFPSGQMFCDVECHGVLTLVLFMKPPNMTLVDNMVLGDQLYALGILGLDANTDKESAHVESTAMGQGWKPWATACMAWASSMASTQTEARALRRLKLSRSSGVKVRIVANICNSAICVFASYAGSLARPQDLCESASLFWFRSTGWKAWVEQIGWI